MKSSNQILFLAVAFLAQMFSMKAHSGSTIEELEQRSITCSDTPDERSYEMEAVGAFWRDVGFMHACAPHDSPLAEPLTIYVEVKEGGNIGQLEITPKTQVAECITKYVRSRELPNPPYDGFIVKISLSFKKE
jgi:hypothetical protein